MWNRQRGGTRRDLLKRIDREIAAHKRRELGRDGWPYLNNFHCRLPGGLYRKILGPDELHQPYGDPQASRKLRGMTPARLFALIDRLIEELGLDARKIRRLQSARGREIYDYAFPLYVRLRQAGFKHHPDLTS
ncbi:MAG: hypothetical protein HYV14_01620 [Elusimicrobia bacterium]|nr:hypothetical protein [Elusimicrobiota bacterium]